MKSRYNIRNNTPCRAATGLTWMLILFFSLICPGFAGERPPIRLGIRTSIPPVSFISWFNDETAIRGISIDISSQVAHYLGREVRFVKCGSILELKQLLSRGRVDAIALTAINDIDPEHLFGYVDVGFEITTRLFVHKSCDTVVCAKDLSGKRVAVLAESQSVKLLKKAKQIDLYPVPSPMEALKLLDRHIVDAYVAPSERVARYLIQQEGLSNIRMVGMPLKKMALGFGIRKDDETMLRELTSAVAKADHAGSLKRIREKWAGTAFDQSLIRTYRRQIFWTAGVALCILFGVIFWNYQLKRRVREVTFRLRTSERRYRNLIESSPDMIFVVDEAGRIITANREAQFFLPSPGEDAQPSLTALVSPGERSQMVDFLFSVFNRQKENRAFAIKDRHGHYKEIDVAATLLPDGSEKHARACLFARDVTQRNRIERELVQADRMTIIGQMAADVAHEINNPIGIVRANIDLILEREWFFEEAREFLESCQRNTVRAGEYTQDLLAIARPKTPEMRRLDLWELVRATLSVMGAQLRKIRVTTRTKGDPAVILGDWNLLQQVLVNLLLNAASAMKGQADPGLSITCCVPQGAGMARLRVEDQGVGIPKPHLNEVFDPFFTRGKKEGFGLGLFISRRIIENHKGVIYAESELGKGTQFIVELPLADQETTGGKG